MLTVTGESQRVVFVAAVVVAATVIRHLILCYSVSVTVTQEYLSLYLNCVSHTPW